MDPFIEEKPPPTPAAQQPMKTRVHCSECRSASAPARLQPAKMEIFGCMGEDRTYTSKVSASVQYPLSLSMVLKGELFLVQEAPSVFVTGCSKWPAYVNSRCINVGHRQAFVV